MKTELPLVRCLIVTWLLAACVRTKMAAANRKYPMEVHQMYQQHVSNGRRATAGVGAWTPWSSWTSCSRSCGGGIATQARHCQHSVERRRRRLATLDKNRCVGVYKRFHVCNQQPCPTGSIDFRQLQCEAFNRKQFMGRIYYWEPFLDGSNPCELNCRPVGFRFYATLNKTVADGTTCKGADPTANYLCVQGQCKHVGCDGVVGSAARLDSCGVCGGHNSSCRLVSGLFTRPTLPVGYNLIAQLPRGACNITVAELKPSKNYLALRRIDGEYVLNGNWAISWTAEYEALGTRFSYKREAAPLGETISAVGPLSEPVDLLLIYQQPNPGIKYEYTLPLAAVAPDTPTGVGVDEKADLEKSDIDVAETRRGDNALYPYGVLGTEGEAARSGGGDDLQHRKTGKPKKRKFGWRVTEYTKCSKTCGGGLQYTVLSCVREHNNQPVTSKRCSLQEKPPTQSLKCNTKPCLAEWVGGEWSECSATCGVGVQTRDIMCKQQITHMLTLKVAEGACLSPLTLAKSQPCVMPACQATADRSWQAGDWSQCSSSCGEGTRTRTVQCTSDSLGECDEQDRPRSSEPCQAAQPCSQHHKGMSTWVFGDWAAECSEGCGTGVQMRRVACLGGACDATSRPDESRACASDKHCSGKWFAGPWGQCTARCGSGKETRQVVCLSYIRGQHRVAPDVNCGGVKPDLERSCEVRSCGQEWFTTDWTQCSSSCGSGMQWREVKCLDESSRASDECVDSHEPAARRTCHAQSCPSDPTVISVGDQAQPSHLDIDGVGECRDKFPNCHLVVQSRLCRYKYYRSSCCVSCDKKQ